MPFAYSNTRRKLLFFEIRCSFFEYQKKSRDQMRERAKIHKTKLIIRKGMN